MNVLPQSPQTVIAGFCGLLFIVLVYQLAAPLPNIDPAAASTPSRAPANAGRTIASVAFSMPSRDSYADIDARPIFNPTRMPIDGAADGSDTASKPPPPPSSSLVGVIIDGDTRMALLRSEGAGFAKTVTVGDDVDGWKVAEVDADQVVLRAGSLSSSLKLEAPRAARQDGSATGISPAPRAQWGANRPNPEGVPRDAAMGAAPSLNWSQGTLSAPAIPPSAAGAPRAATGRMRSPHSD
jgi:general secretion pathway protein N